MRAWTSDEEQYIRDHLKSDKYKQIGVALNRPLNSIKGKVRAMGLQKQQPARARKARRKQTNKFPAQIREWLDGSYYGRVTM